MLFMTSENFSWGIAGFIVTVLASIAGIVTLAFLGYSDPYIYTSLGVLATNALVALSAVMNPNRKFENETDRLVETARELRISAQDASNSAKEVRNALQ